MTNANKNHISLETAKLLKYCGVESKNLFCLLTYIEDDDYKWLILNKNSEDIKYHNVFYPAYTWQEILWEYAEKFWGGTWKATYQASGYCDEAGKTADLLSLLQQKKYEEADKYFREHCILIKN